MVVANTSHSAIPRKPRALKGLCDMVAAMKINTYMGRATNVFDQNLHQGKVVPPQLRYQLDKSTVDKSESSSHRHHLNHCRRGEIGKGEYMYLALLPPHPENSTAASHENNC
jgi:hypothetical protein